MLVRLWERVNEFVGVDLLAGPRIFVTRTMVNEMIVGLAIIVVACVVAISLSVGLSSKANRTAERAQTAQEALCVLRVDLKRRVALTRDFLQAHPEGFLGIPGPTIQASLANQQRTIDALAKLKCPER